MSKAFHTIAIPHGDILDGRLTMHVFAADLWEVCQKEVRMSTKMPIRFLRRRI